MSSDSSKNFSRQIYPTKDWEIKRKDKLPSPQKEQFTEIFNAILFKKLNNFKPLKPVNIKKPIINHLIKKTNLNKEEIKINNKDLEKEENKNNYSPLDFNKYSNESITSKSKKINMKDFGMALLSRSKSQLNNNESDNKKFQNVFNMIDIYKSNSINKKQENTPVVANNKLIPNKLLNINLSNKEKNNLELKNKYYHLGYSPSSAFKATPKNNNLIINLRKNRNIKINTPIQRLLPKLNTSLSKEKKEDNIKKIFISGLNDESSQNSKRFRNLKQNSYIKKWDLPKTFSFDKVIGRQKKIKNPIKLHLLERFYEYSPKYDSVLCNNSKSFVKYDNDIKTDFKQYKINETRKYVFKRLNIMNSPSNNYNIIHLLNDKKQKEKEKIEKRKESKILEYFIRDHNMNINF